MRRSASLALLVLAGPLCFGPAAAQATPPQLGAAWTTGVSAASATLHGEVNPQGQATTYRFEYETESSYLANPPAERFRGAAWAPVSSSCPGPVERGCAGSGSSPVAVSQHLSALRSTTVYRYRLAASSPEGAETLETNPAGAPLTFTTQEPGAAFALPDSRAWEMVSPPDKNGGAIQAPGQIHGGGAIQAAPSGAGKITYSSASSFGGYEALGAPPASQYVSTRTGAGWTTQNITAPTVSGAYGNEPNGAPYQLFSTDLSRALMLDGLRCEEGEPCPRPYSLWEGGAFTALPETAGMHVLGASPDLRRILFEDEGGEAYEWSGAGLTPIAPPAPEAGVLGASADGQTVYRQTEAGLFLSREGAMTEIAPGPEAAQPSDYPPGTGTARVSADGETLLFLSKESLTGYDNHDATTGQPDSEVFLWRSDGGLACLSCNPTGERPLGPSTIPGAYANGAAPGSTDSYKPRALSANGDRAFFTSADAIAALDTDRASDVYQWEAQGEGTCQRPAGCVSLLSSGTGSEGASFLDASESGADAYFLTSASLVGSDPGSADVYDARVGGGFAEPGKPIPCEGDACQPLPSPPEDPTVGTLVAGPGNPPVHFQIARCKRGFIRKHARCVKKHHHPKHHHRRRGHR